jgi:hypothetical protein
MRSTLRHLDLPPSSSRSRKTDYPADAPRGSGCVEQQGDDDYQVGQDEAARANAGLFAA